MHDLEALAPLWLLVALLGASIAVAILTRRWNLPTSVVLVVVGLVIALALPALHVSPAVLVRPELLLAIVLPGLVFEAAFRADLGTIRPAAPAILMLGIPGVVVVAGIVAVLLSATTGISPGEAFLVGSMVAATDPAAVLATFRHLPVPARLATLVEMESLVNDGTGIVLFALALDLLAGHGSFGIALVSFVVVVVGSSLLGAALGWAAVRLVGRVDEHVVELTITIVLAYGTYLLADTLGGSGVIATLVAAGAFGAGARGALTDRSLAAIDVVWELVAFLLTASVFLLVGVSIVPGTLVHAVGPIVWGVVATLVARGGGRLRPARRRVATRRPDEAAPRGRRSVRARRDAGFGPRPRPRPDVLAPRALLGRAARRGLGRPRPVAPAGSAEPRAAPGDHLRDRPVHAAGAGDDRECRGSPVRRAGHRTTPGSRRRSRRPIGPSGGRARAAGCPSSRSGDGPTSGGAHRSRRGRAARSASGPATRCSRRPAGRPRRATSPRTARTRGRSRTDRPAAGRRPRSRRPRASATGRSRPRPRSDRSTSPRRRSPGVAPPGPATRLRAGGGWAGRDPAAARACRVASSACRAPSSACRAIRRSRSTAARLAGSRSSSQAALIEAIRAEPSGPATSG